MQQKYMQLAIEQAQLALKHDEVPIGAIIVQNDQVIASAFNQTVTKCNPIAHAEILAIEKAAHAISNHRLNDCDLYVTLEPCLMCLGAISQARIRKVYYGATDKRSGFFSNGLSTQSLNLNWHVEHEAGLCSNICSTLLKEFFKQRR